MAVSSLSPFNILVSLVLSQICMMHIIPYTQIIKNEMPQIRYKKPKTQLGETEKHWNMSVNVTMNIKYFCLGDAINKETPWITSLQEVRWDCSSM